MKKIQIEKKKYRYWDSIKINFMSSPVLAVVYLLLTAILAVLPTYQVIVNAKFLDNAIALLDGTVSKKVVFTSLVIVILIIAYQWLIDPLMTYISKKIEQNLRLNLRSAIIDRRSKLEYQYIEDQKSIDLIERVSEKAENKMITGYTNLLSLVSLIITIIGILVLLIKEVAGVALLIFVVAVPLFYFAFLSGKATYQANKDITKFQRKYKYLSKVMTERDAVEERTLFEYNPELNKVWFEQYELSRKMELKTRAKWFLKLKAGSVITAIFCIFISGVLIKPAVNGIITIGMFFSLINASFNLVHTMSWQLTRCIDEVSGHIEYLKEFTTFANMQERMDADEQPKGPMEFHSLKFENVRFCYPGTDKYILDGVNLEIERGKHYAFVGINGAGKTTIAKLLTGLYQNYEGNIFVNGKELRNYTAGEIKSLFSVVYQDFARYSISIKDNIALGNFNHDNTEKLQEAVDLLKLGPVIQNLPEGIDTVLGKLKEQGKDVSGGEWQRIALARAFVSEAPIRILDEPTAALDPIAESNLYEEFAKLCKGRTTIFFSHRLGSIKLADYIYVIDGGRVKEQGTHEELMNLNSIYHTMYDSQRRWYQ